MQLYLRYKQQLLYLRTTWKII